MSKIMCTICQAEFDEEAIVQFGDDLVCSECKSTYVQKVKEGCLEPERSRRFKLPILTFKAIASLSLAFGILVFIVVFALTYGQRAQMAADMARKGYGYGPEFHTINCVFGAVVYAFGAFCCLTVYKLIYGLIRRKRESENWKAEQSRPAGAGQ